MTRRRSMLVEDALAIVGAGTILTAIVAPVVVAACVLIERAQVRRTLRTLIDLPPPAEWERYALCKQTDPELFFPEKNQGTHHAKAVCRSCEVTAECGAVALERNEGWGIWGGMTERERRNLKKGDAA